MFVNTPGSSGGVNVGDSHSLRFAASRSCYASRVWGAPSNNLKWAILFWLRRGVMGTTTPIFSAGDGSSNTSFYIEFLNTDTIIIRQLSGGVGSLYATTSAVFRDPTGFVPFLLYYDSANATAADRIQLWQGDASVGSSGKRLTLNYTTGPFAQNTASQANVNGRTHYWGKLDFAGIYGDFYLARSCFFDNANPSLTSLMQVNSQINEFVSLSQATVKSVVEAAGAQSSMLDFDDGSSLTTLGYDKSSKGNNWTLSGHSLTAGVNYDWMLDVPGNSYAVINSLLPVSSTAPTISDANLKWTRASTAPGWTAATMPLPQAGKWYWETDHTSDTSGAPLWSGVVNSTRGAADDNASNIAGVKAVTGGWDGKKTNATTVASYINPGALTATLAHAYDGATGKYWCGYVSGGSITWGTNGGVGDPAAGTNALETLSGVVTPAFGQFQAAGATRTITEYFNAGQRPFSASTLPTGFKALCQANMPEVPAAYLNPRKHADVVTRTGTSANASVSSLQFQPDFVWAKSRNTATDNRLFDVVRGLGVKNKELSSNITAAEGVDTSCAITAAANGYSFSDGSSSWEPNVTGETYVDWLWKAGGAGVSNTAGSITSTVSANTDIGFSIVTYTGTGANATVGHGCKVNGVATAPGLIIVKQRSAAGMEWNVYHVSSGATKYLELNTTIAATTGANRWNDTQPTSTVFSISTANVVNQNTRTFVAYCFAPGFFSIGSYTGNGNADGPFVYTGHKPRWLLMKQSSGAGGTWCIFDSAISTYNVIGAYLNPNASTAETTGETYVDFDSVGFKLRGTSLNTSTETYIYISIPDVHAKYSLAR